jgi:L-iditol 2-dehydrogenase
MLARLLVLAGREVTVADRHPERRAQAEALGARTVETLARHDLVFEAVGRPETWRAAVDAAGPGATVVLVGGCAAGTEAVLRTGPLHYDELDVRGSFHHSPAEVDHALSLLAAGDVDWRVFAGPVIGLDGLAAALAAPTEGPAHKIVVEPARA